MSGGGVGDWGSPQATRTEVTDGAAQEQKRVQAEVVENYREARRILAEVRTQPSYVDVSHSVGMVAAHAAMVQAGVAVLGVHGAERVLFELGREGSE